MKPILLGACCWAALTSGSIALAQDAAPADESGVEEITVTAQKRTENVQDVPIAITAFSATALQDKRVNNIIDLNNLSPGLRISTADAAANPKIFIRGAGLNDFNPTSSSGVGIYVDGVYIGSPLAQMAGFFDMQRVEVLRGPQGTLYGRNTTGGAINVISRQPTFEPSLDASVEYGRFDSMNISLGYGDAIVADKLAFRLSGQYVEDDGYSTNRITGNGLNDANRLALRGQLLFTPTENDSFTLTVNRFINRGGATQVKHRALFPATPEATGPDGLCAPGFYQSGLCTDAVGYADLDPDPYSVEANTEGKDKIDLFSAALNYTHDFDTMSLVSITAYQNARRYAEENTDANPLEFLEIDYITKQKQFSQELRLQSDAGAIKWVAGLYYMHDEIDNASSTDLLRLLRPLFVTPENPNGLSFENFVYQASYPYTQKTDSYAIFGQADYDVTEKFQISVGLRWSQDQKSMENYQRLIDGVNNPPLSFSGSKSFSDFSGRIAVKYDITDDTNVFASYSRGYKSGGFFGGSADEVSQLEPYDNETVNAFEIGSKSTLFDRALRLNLSAFYYDYQNIQAFALVERGGVTVQILDNAGSAEMYGAEAEITATPFENFDLSMSLGYLHAEYGDYVSLGGDYSGNRMPQAPEITFTTTAAYTIDIGENGSIKPQVDVSYRSSVFFDATETARIATDALWQVNAQLSWISPEGEIEAGLWGRNLTDEDSIVAISPIDSLGLDLLTYAPPATYGVFVRYAY
jgi:iron complex outermembrane receptor protein